jgi:hypothetical protein
MIAQQERKRAAAPPASVLANAELLNQSYSVVKVLT